MKKGFGFDFVEDAYDDSFTDLKAARKLMASYCQEIIICDKVNDALSLQNHKMSEELSELKKEHSSLKDDYISLLEAVVKMARL